MFITPEVPVSSQSTPAASQSAPPESQVATTEGETQAEPQPETSGTLFPELDELDDTLPPEEVDINEPQGLNTKFACRLVSHGDKRKFLTNPWTKPPSFVFPVTVEKQDDDPNQRKRRFRPEWQEAYPWFF